MKATNSLTTAHTLAETTSAPPTQTAIALILVGCAIMFSILQIGTTWLPRLLDMTWAALIATAIMLGVAIVCERLIFKLDLRQALRALGFGRPEARTLLVAGLLTGLMLAFFPLFSLATQTHIGLKSDWLWILVGAIALNGIAEETLFRGFVFGGLRRTGLSFGRAGAISMVIFAAVHTLLFIQNPPIIALLGTLIAMTAAFPMAYLFEWGGNRLWAPVVLHIAPHLIRLVDIPEPHAMPAVIAWLVLQICLLFVVLVFRGNLLKPLK